MNEAATIAKLLGCIAGLKQAELSVECNINKGQLSAFIKGNGSLAEDKQVALISALMKKLDGLEGQGTNLPIEAKECINALKTYQPYQALYGSAEPKTVILPGHHCYVERPMGLLQETQSRPFVLGITGGPKTGKSNLGRGLQYLLRKEKVIFADCNDFASEGNMEPERFVSWLVNTAKKQWAAGFNKNPRDWNDLVQWLKADILKDAPCTFIFDHVEALGSAYQEFSSGWHHVLNQSRREPVLDTIGLVLIFDEADKVVHTTKTHGSRLEQRMRTLVAQALPEGKLNDLVKAIVVANNDNEAAELSNRLWTLFHGHPYLTHCYLHAFAYAQANEAGSKAIQAAQTAFEQDIFPKLIKNVYSDALREVFKTKQEALIELDCKSIDPSHAMFLQDSLLFVELDNGNLSCATPWIQQRLIESMTTMK